MVTPIVSGKYRRLYQFCYVKLLSTNHNKSLQLLNDPGRVRSQIISVVCQIEWDDSTGASRNCAGQAPMQRFGQLSSYV